MGSPTADVLIVGGGLAGSLLALELRQRGLGVILLEAAPGPQAASATAWSYGAIPGWPLAPTPLARAAAGASRHWRALQRRHGDLGWRPVRARLLGGGVLPAALVRLGLLPLAQVDASVLLTRLPGVLAAAGVAWRAGEALLVEPVVAGGGTAGGGAAAVGWRVQLADGVVLEAPQLVLAAGAGCRRLWSALPPTLQCSWAGVLAFAGAASGPGGGRPELLLPGRFERIALERRSGAMLASAWVVDAGLVPRGGEVLLGQLSWIPAAGDGAAAASGPPAAQAELWLRQGFLAGTRALTDTPGLAAAPALAMAQQPGQGHYRQVPVAFCSEGRPLAGPVAGAPGLWLFSGFSGGFAQVPVLAPLLAAAITAATAAITAARGAGPPAAPGGASGGVPGPVRELQRLGVWPLGRDLPVAPPS